MKTFGLFVLSQLSCFVSVLLIMLSLYGGAQDMGTGGDDQGDLSDAGAFLYIYVSQRCLLHPYLLYRKDVSHMQENKLCQHMLILHFLA